MKATWEPLERFLKEQKTVSLSLFFFVSVMSSSLVDKREKKGKKNVELEIGVFEEFIKSRWCFYLVLWHQWNQRESSRD